MTRLRLAVVGAGRRSHAHLPVIAKMRDHYALVAVCDIREEQARAAGAQYSVPWYTDLRRMLREVRPDVCDVIVPGEAHHVVAPPIAEAGAHLLVETPLGITLPAIDLMLQAAQRHHVYLEVAENVWRFPYERLRQRVLERGLLGEPLRGYCVYPTGGYHAVNGARVSVGGTARRVWGRVERWPVPLVTDHAGRQIAEEVWTLGVVDFDNGRTAIVEYSNTYSTILRREGPRYIGVAATRGHAFSPSYASPGTVCLIEGNQARTSPMREDVREVDRPAQAVGLVEGDHDLLIMPAGGRPIRWRDPLAHRPMDAAQLIGHGQLPGGDPILGEGVLVDDRWIGLDVEPHGHPHAVDLPHVLPHRRCTGLVPLD